MNKNFSYIISYHYNIEKFTENLKLNSYLKNNDINSIIKILNNNIYDLNILIQIFNYYFIKKKLDFIISEIVNNIKNEILKSNLFFMLGYFYRLAKDNDKCEKYYLLSFINYKNLYAGINLTDYYFQINNIKEGETYCIQILNSNLIDLEIKKMILCNLGNFYYLKKDYDIMKYYYQQSIEIFNCPKSSINLANYYLTIENNLNNCKLFYEKALTSNYQATDVKYSYGIYYYYIINNNIKASEYLMESFNFGEQKAYNILKNICLELNDINTLEEVYNIGMNKYNLPDAWFNYTSILKNKNYNKDIINFYYEKAAILKHPLSLVRMGIYHFSNKEYELALKYFYESIEYKEYRAYFLLALYYDIVEKNYIKAYNMANLAIYNDVVLGNLYLAKYFLYNDYNLDLAKNNISKYIKKNNCSKNSIELDFFEQFFGKTILYNILILNKTKNIFIRNKINNLEEFASLLIF